VLHDYLSPDAKKSNIESKEDSLTAEKILQLPSMPALCPSYPRKPPVFSDREFLIIEYRTTDIKALQDLVPDSLEVDPEGRIYVEWVKTHGSGLGGYEKVCDV